MRALDEAPITVDGQPLPAYLDEERGREVRRARAEDLAEMSKAARPRTRHPGRPGDPLFRPPPAGDPGRFLSPEEIRRSYMPKEGPPKKVRTWTEDYEVVVQRVLALAKAYAAREPKSSRFLGSLYRQKWPDGSLADGRIGNILRALEGRGAVLLAKPGGKMTFPLVSFRGLGGPPRNAGPASRCDLGAIRRRAGVAEILGEEGAAPEPAPERPASKLEPAPKPAPDPGPAPDSPPAPATADAATADAARVLADAFGMILSKRLHVTVDVNVRLGWLKA